MRRNLTAVAVAAAISVVPASVAFATTNPADPDDVAVVDNPLDENDDDGGFDDWGLFGLLGLLGLAGLAGRKRQDVDATYRGRGSTDIT